MGAESIAVGFLALTVISMGIRQRRTHQELKDLSATNIKLGARNHELFVESAHWQDVALAADRNNQVMRKTLIATERELRRVKGLPEDPTEGPASRFDDIG